MADLKPWEDVPLHDCRDGTKGGEHPKGEGYLAPVHTLVCVACGDGVVGTPEQVAQAERARVAWEAERAR